MVAIGWLFFDAANFVVFGRLFFATAIWKCRFSAAVLWQLMVIIVVPFDDGLECYGHDF